MVIWNGVLDVFVTVIIIWVKSSRIVRLMAIQKLTQFFTDWYITVLAIRKIATMAIWVNWVIIIWSGGTRPCVRGCAALLLVTPVVSNEQLIMLQSWMFKCLWRGKKSRHDHHGQDSKCAGQHPQDAIPKDSRVHKCHGKQYKQNLWSVT